MNQAALQWIFGISKLAITQWMEEARQAEEVYLLLLFEFQN